MTTLCQPKVRVRQCDLFFFTAFALPQIWPQCPDAQTMPFLAEL